MLNFDSIEVASESDWRGARSMSAFRSERHRSTGRVKHLRGPSSEKRTLLHKPICAIDGEGKTRPLDNRHDYVLLAASYPGGKLKMTSDSLTFDNCMEFLLALPPDHCYVIFGGNYDCNMMLNSLPHEIQDRLLDFGKAYYHGYRLRWIERKFFTVARGKQSRTVYDVWANFQSAFVKLEDSGRGACEEWGIGTPDEIELVRSMKHKRGALNDEEDEDIEKYCFLECDLLGQLCRKFFDAILETPYRPRAVYGPGALASAAMEKHGVKRYMSDLPDEIDFLTRHAYFGGRFDCSLLGWFTDVWQYDIKSAYPDQIRFLPCLKHGAWSRFNYADYKAWNYELPKWALVWVEWNVSDTAAWPPFPHRDTKGNVFYPYKGRGWYHAEEVRAAIEMYGREAIIVIAGWRYDLECKHVPFDFVEDLYATRQKLPKGQGIVFKLILNSLYGKTAQRVGSREGKKPTFQNFFWAGAITSGTRAKLLRAIRGCPTSVLGVATDSIVSNRQLDIPIGTELGEWDSNHLAEYAQVSNGIYRAIDDNGKEIERSRGFGRATLDWEQVKKTYAKSRGVGKFSFQARARFITIREARQRIDRNFVQCRWIVQQRSISFWPARRFPGTYNKSGPTMTLEPYEPLTTFDSQPFKIKTSQEIIDARIQYNAYDLQDYA